MLAIRFGGSVDGLAERFATPVQIEPMFERTGVFRRSQLDRTANHFLGLVELATIGQRGGQRIQVDVVLVAVEFDGFLRCPQARSGWRYCSSGQVDINQAAL